MGGYTWYTHPSLVYQPPLVYPPPPDIPAPYPGLPTSSRILPSGIPTPWCARPQYTCTLHPPPEGTWDQAHPLPSKGHGTRHIHPLLCGQTNTSKNITFPQLHWRAVIIMEYCISLQNVKVDTLVIALLTNADSSFALNCNAAL